MGGAEVAPYLLHSHGDDSGVDCTASDVDCSDTGSVCEGGQVSREKKPAEGRGIRDENLTAVLGVGA